MNKVIYFGKHEWTVWNFNGLVFDVVLQHAGYKPLEFSIENAKGTAEVAD